MDKKQLEPALHFLRDILQDLRKYCYVFLVTDSSGIVEFYFSNTDKLPKHYRPGVWTEASMGNNAIAVAIRNNKLSFVCGAEHSHPGLQQYFSVAAPFRDENHTTLGYFAVLSNEMAELNIAKVWLTPVPNPLKADCRLINI